MNPWIFQPEWLREHKIIGQTEAEASKNAPNQIIHNHVTALNFNALKLVVDVNRFAVTCLEEPLVRAKDFAVGCFRLLSHTPVGMLGLNREVVFRASTYDAYHRLGDRLGPKAPWAVLLGHTDSTERSGGLQSITMERSRRPEGLPGYIRVTVEALRAGHPDVKVAVNDHFALGESGTGADICRLIDEHWETSIDRSEKIIDSLKEQSDAA
jgi:hypothetical protein